MQDKRKKNTLPTGGIGEDLSLYKKLFSEMNDLAYVCDDKGNLLFINKAFERITGRTIEEFLGKPFAPLLDEDNLRSAMDAYNGALRGENSQGEIRFKDTGVCCEFKSRPWRDKDGNIIGVMGTARDVTERKLALDSLKSQRDLAQKYLDVAGVIFIVIEADQRVKLINRKGCQVLGYREYEIVGKNWFDNFLPAACREDVRRGFVKLISGEGANYGYLENPVLARGGAERVIAWHNTVLRGDSGRIYATLSSGSDVTEANENAAELRRYRNGLEEQIKNRTHELVDANSLLKQEVADRKKAELELRKLSMAIEQSVNMVFITDVKGSIEYVNPMFEQVTEWPGEEIIGENPRLLASKDTPKERYIELWDTILLGDTWRGVFKNKKKSGETYWVSSVISPIKNEDGEITHFLAVQEDITEKRSSKETIERLAHYDGTTGLMNRARFIGLLNDWLLMAPEDRGALLLLDIDQFKFISDTYGHGLGDEFLRRVAGLLQTTLRYLNSQRAEESRNDSILCRLSGDEFAAFLPSADKSSAMKAAEQIRAALEGFYQADVHCHMTASVGVSLYPEHGKTTTQLLTKADAAMYKAKELGRNRCHLYSPEDRDIEKMYSRLKWKESILKALKEDRFEAWFQPIVSLTDGKTRHYEALARMRELDGSIVQPGPFIDIAERFGLVGAITRAVMEKAMRLQKNLSDKGRPLTFCLNISGKELGEGSLLDSLRLKIQEIGVDPGYLIFEITETSSIHDMDRAVRFVRSLKSMGCHISLDDFGVGYTSFLYLKEMQVDYVKIAGPFIKGMEKNLNDRLFVKAITDVAKGMGIKTIAEFVENSATVELLKELGVDYAQGYYMGRPDINLCG